MSIEENNLDVFTIVRLGNESNKTKIKFTNYDQLKTILINKKDSSVIIILSNTIPLDTLLPIDLPQICAVYNDKLMCLYCLPTMVELVDNYMKQTHEDYSKEISKRSYLSYLFLFIQRYRFLIGLAIVIVLGYFFPNVGKTGGFIRSEWSVKWGCVILVFFLTGLSLRTKQIATEVLRIHLHAFLQIYSLLIIPFTIYGLGLLLARFSIINKTLIFGIIISCSTSTSISSNVVMTKNAMGNECAALLNAILGNILGIFVSPALIFYFMKNSIFESLSNTNNTDDQVDYIRVIKNLSVTVLIPLCIGQIIHLLWTKQVTYIRKKCRFKDLNSLALLALVWSVFCNAFANGSFKRIDKKDFLILIIIDGGIYIIFSLLIMITARLPIPYWQFSQKDTVAIMFCGAMKTLAMGIPLINALYGNKNQEIIGLISLPLIVYQVEQLILGAFQVILLKNWVQKALKKQTTDEKRESETINIKC